MPKRKRNTHDFDEEMRAHLALEADALKDEGLGDEEARRRARVAFGNLQAAHERFYLKSRPEWIAWLDNLARDLKYAVRQLARHPEFALTATLTLALGIGANTAIFTVIQSVLLAPLPYANPGRLALLETHWTDSGHTAPRMTGPDSVDVRDQAKDLEAVSLFAGGNEGVELRDHATYTEVTWTDDNFARVFSLRPIAGRLQPRLLPLTCRGFRSGSSHFRARGLAAGLGLGPPSRRHWKPSLPQVCGRFCCNPSAFSATMLRFFTTWIFSSASLPPNGICGWSGQSH